jgi:hypothetical protein
MVLRRHILGALLIASLTSPVLAQRAGKPNAETREQLLAKAMAADGLGEFIKVVEPASFCVDRAADPSQWLHLDNSGPDLLRPLPATVTLVRGKDGAADRLVIDSPHLDVPCRFDGAIAPDGITVSGQARCGDETSRFRARIHRSGRSGAC